MMNRALILLLFNGKLEHATDHNSNNYVGVIMPNRPDEIERLPEFVALTRARRKIVFPLAMVSIVAYFALILIIAFSPGTLAKSLTGGTFSVGIALGLGLIFLCFIVTGIYVTYANNVIEPLVAAVKKRIGELK